MKALLIAYDSGSHIGFFPLHLSYLSSSMKRAGWDVEICAQDLNHWPDEYLTLHLDVSHYDLVGLGCVAGYYQFKKLLSLSAAVNASKNRKHFKYVLGGHGPAAAPEYFLDKCGADHVVVGEGEQAILSLDAPVVHAPRIKDVDALPWPDWENFDMSVYRLHRFPGTLPHEFAMPVLSGRGCPYHCTFCYRMTPGFRPRSVDAVLDEIDYLRSYYGISHYQFADELLMSSESRAIEFSETILRQPYKIKWDCNGRLNFATPEVLAVMKRSGCNYINYGVEALDDEVLRRMHKKLTVETIYRGVEATIAAGITPGLNIMWGNPGDTIETLAKAVGFLLKYDGIAELRTIRPSTPYPGCELFNLAVEQGKIKDVADFYENKHTNSDLFTVSFLEGIDSERGNRFLAAANEQLVMGYYLRCAEATLDRAMRFYRGEDKSFRGYRSV